MKKSELLENEINSAIATIGLLNESSRLEVYNLFFNIYKKAKDLPREDFINDFYYQSYFKFISISKPIFEEELNNLKHCIDDDTNTSDNFFQIKASIFMMSPKKFIK